MASVQETVKYGLLEYPGIFPDVGAVLHHLFAVNGNGYEWEDGELVSWGGIPSPIDVGKIAAGEREQFRERMANLREIIDDPNVTLREERELHDYEFTVAHIDRIVSDYGIRRHRVGGRLYPICEYAQILHVPDDVKLDWLQAAYHFVQNLQTTFRQGPLDADEQAWAEALPGLAEKFDDMLVARGAMATKAVREERVASVIADIKGYSVRP